jgi:hypothetical protein
MCGIAAYWLPVAILGSHAYCVLLGAGLLASRPVMFSVDGPCFTPPWKL